MSVVRTDVAIIGAGLTGLSTAAGLKRRGMSDFVVLERVAMATGTWCADTVKLFGLGANVRLGWEVAGLSLDEESRRWLVNSSTGEQISARSVVLATGSRADDKPLVPGIETYAGTIVHGQQFRDLDLAGKRVAVVGNGAATATLLPPIVRTAAQVKLFQTSADWVLPRQGDLLERSLRRVPALRSATRHAWFWGRSPRRRGLLELLAQRNLRRNVEDEWTRRQLTPLPLTDRPSVVVADDFYAALQAPNCKFITWPIARFSRDGIRTAEGIEHRCDVIVFASGSADGPTKEVAVTGRGGVSLPATIATTVAGFPGLFLPNGPDRDAVREMRSRVHDVVEMLKETA